MTNDELYDMALEAINKLFSDQTVSREKCKENLNSLIGEIEVMISALDTDDNFSEDS